MNGSRLHRRRGFTIVEIVVTAFLMALVGILLGNAWAAFARPAITTVARCRVAQEANLAAEAIARDVGRLAWDADPQHHDSRYQKAQVIDDMVVLYTGDGTTKVTYGLDPNDPTMTRLMRTEYNGPAFSQVVSERVVATLLGGFDTAHRPIPGFVASAGTLHGVGHDNTDVQGIQIDMTFTHRTMDRDPMTRLFRGDHTRCYTLFIPDPQTAS